MVVPQRRVHQAPVLRHLSPPELAVLCGVSPELCFEPDLGLSLALIGHAAFPFQSAWIGAQLRHALVHGSAPVGDCDRMSAACNLLNRLHQQLYSQAIMLGMRVEQTLPEAIPLMQLNEISEDEETVCMTAGAPDAFPLQARPVQPRESGVELLCPGDCLVGAMLDGLLPGRHSVGLGFRHVDGQGVPLEEGSEGDAVCPWRSEENGWLPALITTVDGGWEVVTAACIGSACLAESLLGLANVTQLAAVGST